MATTFFVDGDEKFAPDLLELLHRSAQAAGQRTKAPAQWLREMAGVAVVSTQLTPQVACGLWMHFDRLLVV